MVLLLRMAFKRRQGTRLLEINTAPLTANIIPLTIFLPLRSKLHKVKDRDHNDFVHRNNNGCITQKHFYVVMLPNPLQGQLRNLTNIRLEVFSIQES